jgi:hypothetical protein
MDLGESTYGNAIATCLAALMLKALNIRALLLVL